MEKRFSGSFKKPHRSMLGRRNPRPSLTGPLEPISESATSSTSRHSLLPLQDTTLTADDTVPLGYDSLCDETLRTPCSKSAYNDSYLRTPTCSSSLRFPSGYTDSHKKPSRFSRNEPPSLKSVSLQTSQELDKFGTPPHVLRKRLGITCSAYTDLQVEYKDLQEYTTLEKQVLSTEGFAELQVENTKLKVDAYHLMEESRALKDKIALLEKDAMEKSVELQLENDSLKQQLEKISDEAASLREKQATSTAKNIDELEAEIISLKDQVNSLTLESKSLNDKLEDIKLENERLIKKAELSNNTLIEVEMACEAKEKKWLCRELELTTSLQEAWKLLEDAGIKKDGSNNCDRPAPLEVQKYSLIMNSLNEQIRHLNNLQVDIAERQSSFVLKVEDKSLHIISLAERTKDKLEQIRLKSEKLNSLEEILKTKDHEIINIRSQIDSIKENAANYTTQIYQLLTGDKLSDIVNFDDLLIDLKQLVNRISSSETTTDGVFDGISTIFSKLAELFNGTKNQRSLEEERFNALLAEKDSSITRLSEELNVMSNKIADFECEIKRKDEELTNMQGEIVQKETINIDLRDQITDSSTKLENVMENLNEKTQMLESHSGYFEKLAGFASLISSQPVEVNDSNFDVIFNSLKTKYLEFLDLTEFLTNILLAHESQFSDSEKLISPQRLSHQQLKTLLLKIDDAYKTVSFNLESGKEDLKLKTEMIDTFKTKCEELQAENKEYKNKINRLEFDLSEIKQIINNKNEYIKEIEVKLDACKCVLLESEKELLFNSIRAELLDYEQNQIINSYDDIIRCFKNNFSSVKNEISSLQEEIKNISNNYNEMKELYSKADSKTIELSERLELCRCSLTVKEQLSFFETVRDVLLINAVEDEVCYFNCYEDVLNCLKTKLISNKDINEDLASQIETKENQLKDLSCKFDAMTNQLNVTDSKIKELEEKVNSCQCNLLVNERDSFFEFFKNCLSNECSNSDICSFQDVITCFKSIMSSNDDLKEHLRNKLHSKDDQLKELTCCSNIIRENIVKAEERIKELEEKLNLCHCDSLLCEQNSFFNIMNDFVTRFESDLTPIKNYSDIIKFLNVNFSANYDLNELLRDKIESKEDQLKEMKNCCNTTRQQLLESDVRVKDLEDKVSSCCCDSILEQRQLFLNSIRHYLNSINCCNLTINIYDDVLSALKHAFTHKEQLQTVLHSKEFQLQSVENMCSCLKKELLESYQKLGDLENKLFGMAEELSFLEGNEKKEKQELQFKVIQLENDLKYCSGEFSGYKNIMESKISEMKELREHLDNKLQSKDDIILYITKELKMSKNKSSHEAKKITEDLSARITEIAMLDNSVNHDDDKIAQLGGEILTKSIRDSYENDNIDCEINHCELETENLFPRDQSSVLQNEANLFEDEISIQKNLDERKQLQEKINQLTAELHNSSDAFCSFEQSTKSKILELEEFKEHLANTIQSKTEKISKLAQKYKMLKDECLLNENRYLEEIAVLTAETNCLKASEKQLIESCTDYKNEISHLEEKLSIQNYKNEIVKESESKIKLLEASLSESVADIEVKDGLIKELKDRLDECQCDSLISEKQSFFQTINTFMCCNDCPINNYNGVIDCLNNVFNSNYDLNEYLRDKIESKEDQLREITKTCESLKEKIEKVEKINEDLETRLDKCTCSIVVNEQLSFFSAFNQFLSDINSFNYQINSYDDIIDFMKNKISSVIDLNEHLRNQIKSKEDQMEDLIIRFSLQNDKLEDSRRELCEVEYHLNKTMQELGSLKQSQEGRKEADMKLLLDQIRMLNGEFKLSLDSFSHYKQNIISRIADLTDLKEHSDNQIQSKSDQLLIISQEFKLFKEKSLAKEKMLEEELSSRNKDICNLKIFEKQYLEQIFDFEEKNSLLEEKLSCKSSEFESEIKQLKHQLHENKDIVVHQNEIIKEMQIKIDNCGCDFMMKEQERFFNSFNDYLSSFDCTFEPVESYNDVVTAVQMQLSSVNDLNEHLRDKIESKQDQLSETLTLCEKLKLNFAETDKKCKTLTEKLQMCCCKSLNEELQIFIGDLRDLLCLSIDDMPPLNNYNDIMDYLKHKFLSMSDLNEHLRNQISSKGELYDSLLHDFKTLKQELDNSLLQLNDMQDKLIQSQNGLKQAVEKKDLELKNVEEANEKLTLAFNLVSDDFSEYKQNMSWQISELTDLKEHLHNKLQSKDDQLIKLNQEFDSLKKSGLLNEHSLKEELSFKVNEIKKLKMNETGLLERISKCENQISNIQEELKIKNIECQNLNDKVETLSYLLEDKTKDNFKEKAFTLEKHLSEVLEELDCYKTSEVSKEATIDQLQKQVDELNNSVASKTKETQCHLENMDRLSQNIVQLTQEKEIFLDKLKPFALAINLKSFDDVLEVFKINYTEIASLKDEKSNIEGKLELVKGELSSLKEEYEKMVSRAREWNDVVSELLQSLSFKDFDEDALDSKDKIIQINTFIQDQFIIIDRLEKELEAQFNNNSSNMNLQQQMNLEISSQIESINRVISELCADLSTYKVYFEQQISIKELEMEKLEKEVSLGLGDIRELISVSDKQNSDVVALIDAYSTLHTEYKAFVSSCKTSITSLFDSDNDLLNEYDDFSQSLMAFVYQMNSHYRDNAYTDQYEYLFSECQSFMDQLSQASSTLFDSLYSDFHKNIETLKSDLIHADNDLEMDLPVSPSFDWDTLRSSDFTSLIKPCDSEFEAITDLSHLSQLVDSLSKENKILDLIHSTQRQQWLENNLSVKNDCESQFSSKKKAAFIPHKDENTNMSLLMSVVDQTALDSSALSCNNYDSLHQSFGSPCPEKSQYILPGGPINTSDVQLEKTLYLPNNVIKTHNSDVDPFKAVDKSMGVDFPNTWLTFGNNKSDYLDESGNEFHDAQYSTEGEDPLSVSPNPLSNEVELSLLNTISSQLKQILPTECQSDEQMLDQVRAIITSIESVKSCVQQHYPDISNCDIGTIFKYLIDKISILEKNEFLFEKYQALNSSFKDLQSSVKHLKEKCLLVSSDVKQSQEFVFSNFSFISNLLENIINVANNREKQCKEEIESLVEAQEKLKNSHDGCLNELQSVLKTNFELQESLENCRQLLKETSAKYEELLKDQDSLVKEFDKVKMEYNDVKEVTTSLKDNLESKTNETISLDNQISALQCSKASLEKLVDESEIKFKSLAAENTNLLSEVACLKEQLKCSDVTNLNLIIEKQSTKLSTLEESYNLLKSNHEELLNKLWDTQKQLDSSEVPKSIKMELIKGLQSILKTLNFDEEFNLRDDLTATLSKIQRRISLIQEHQSVSSVSSSTSEINSLNQKIRCLESDIHDARSFKLSFSKELQSLKPQFKINDLLERPLAELHTLMITEIMTRENVIISNLKNEYDKKIMSLKEQLQQFGEKDKRRADWVSEVETENEQLVAMTKQLKTDFNSAQERLESKLFCEKLIVKELKLLEKKINCDFVEDYSSDDLDLDAVKRGETCGDILVKLQKIVRDYSPSEESAIHVNKYKENIKSLESKCLKLEDKINELELLRRDSNKEIDQLKCTIEHETNSYKKEIDVVTKNMKTLEHKLTILREKLSIAEGNAKREQEQLQRERAFSVTTLKENEFNKKQLEEHIGHLNKINSELRDTKETIRALVAKHEEEVSSLMKVITNLECELKLSQKTGKEKDTIESELSRVNKQIFDLKQQFESQISELENENKTLKNEINMKLKEITLLKEEHEREILGLKMDLNSNTDVASSLKADNEDFKAKICLLRSEIGEKEALYRDSVSALMREREIHLDQITTLETFANDSKTMISALESKLIESEKMYRMLMTDVSNKEKSFKEQLLKMASYSEELKRKYDESGINIEKMQKSHTAEINLLTAQINNYLLRISQLEKCVRDSQETEKGFNDQLLKLFPQFSSCSLELVAQIKSKLAEISELKEELEDKTSECHDLEEDCDNMIKAYKDMQERIGVVCQEKYEGEIKFKELLSEKDLQINNLQTQLSSIPKVDLDEIKNKESMIVNLQQSIQRAEHKLKETKVSLANLSEENASLRTQISQKPKDCQEFKQIMEQVIHCKAKLSVKELKISELTRKIVDIETEKKDIVKKNDEMLGKYKEKINELEKDKGRMAGQMSNEPSGSPLRAIDNHQSSDHQSSKIAKLEARIAKLEKDRDFLKRLCDKRATVINKYKEELESKK